MKQQIISTNYCNSWMRKKYVNRLNNYGLTVNNINLNDTDTLLYVVKNEDGSKEIKIKEEPIIQYFVTKPEYRDNIFRRYIEQDKVFSVTAKYNSLYKSMVESLNDPAFSRQYNEIFERRDNINNDLRKLHLNYNFHSSDVDVEDFFINGFLNKYPFEDNYIGITSSFYDIEVDTTNHIGFPDEQKAECPINIVTLVFNEDNTSYTLMLKYDTDTYKEFINNIDQVIIELKEKYNNYKKGLGDLVNFEFYEYENEIDLIEGFFELVNEKKPDFSTAWNAKFDFCTFFNRIINLGYDPKEIMCPKELSSQDKYVEYKLDYKHTDPADKREKYICTGYTNWIDSMNLYASLTKMDGKLESYSLDFVTNKELNIGKDDTLGGLKDLHLVDYTKFCKYNIQDTMLLFLLEMEKNQIESIYLLSMLTRTRLSETLKKTTSLKNYYMDFHLKNGLILSNNRSHLYNGEKKYNKGAFVADPNHIDNVGLDILDI